MKDVAKKLGAGALSTPSSKHINKPGSAVAGDRSPCPERQRLSRSTSRARSLRQKSQDMVVQGERQAVASLRRVGHAGPGS